MVSELHTKWLHIPPYELVELLFLCHLIMSLEYFLQSTHVAALVSVLMYHNVCNNGNLFFLPDFE